MCFGSALKHRAVNPYLPSFPENIKGTTPVVGNTTRVGQAPMCMMLRSIKDVEFKFFSGPFDPFNQVYRVDSKRTSPESVQYSAAISLLGTAFTPPTLRLTACQTCLKVLEGGKVFRKPERGS